MLKARKSKRWISVLVTLVFLFSLLPAAAFAASNNSVNKVPQVATDHKFDATSAPILRIEEKNNDEFGTASQTFRLVLENAKFIRTSVADSVYGFDSNLNNPGSINLITDTIAEVTITPNAGIVSAKESWDFKLITEITGDGEAKVTVDPRDSAVSGGTYVFANAASGATVASIEKVVSFERSNTLGTIQIDETRIGALGTGDNQVIKIKLPPKFSWVIPADAHNKVKFTGGLAGSSVDAGKVETEGDDRTLKVTYTLVAGPRATRGSIFLEGFGIRADRDAPYGDVYADFDGTKITNQELLVAKHVEYGVTATVKEVKDVLAGRHDQKTAKITIEETIPKSLIVSRELNVVLPEWVKIREVKDFKATNAVVKQEVVSNYQNEMFIELTSVNDPDKKVKYEFELELSVEADKSGEIVAEFFGAGMEEQELVIANAVAPVTAEVAVSDLRIGVQKQDAPDIIITENKKGAIDDYIKYYTTSDTPEGDPTGKDFALTVSLPDKHNFASTPTVEVTEGNLEIGKPTVDDNVLTIPIKSSSTKPSTIVISDVKVTLDRTVPEGPFDAKIGGTAIVKNNWSKATLSTPVLFDKAYVYKFHYADVITPAPGEIRATTTFTIGNTTYTVVEAAEAVEYTMDVAPYIKDGRTYLPVRYVGYALGVDAENILWDAGSATVTILKGDRIAQMKIGSNVLLLNGAQITMDAAPEIVGGRTMLPVRWVAQALGASIEWDAATQQVTVTQ